MNKFLEKRELVSFTLVVEVKVNINDFLKTRIVKTNNKVEEATVFPDGSFHGMRTVTKKSSEKVQEYFFGIKHGKYCLSDNEKKVRYFGNFVRGVPSGLFGICSERGEVLSSVFYDENGTIIRHKHFARTKCPLKCKIYGHDIDYAHEFFWEFSGKDITMVSVLTNRLDYTTKFRNVTEDKEVCWDYFLSCRRNRFLPRQSKPEFLFTEEIEETNKKQGKPMRRICLP
ncbi:hypothetical protein ISTM_151 [Insectomime virus]|uniref:MORN repeat-containing protein n=1 Tax=Tunisvirus fontaine2 TaxID=1421067 RepID=V9SGJ5_9VIRU|nr:hypothetical protein D1R32_gp170 [Tunisvirus fontaine2]AHA46049.1 hypothetical protein ISTM_151 [Insectomime virus]AHC54887.1 hypothetical protein TNS_ORF169 [Tunisvirus fontaine2]